MPRVLPIASGGAPGATSLAYSSDLGQGFHTPPTATRRTRTASAVSSFWQEHQSLLLISYPDFTRPPAAPRPWTLTVPFTVPLCQAGDAVGGSALCWYLAGGSWHHAILLLTCISAHVSQEKPTFCHCSGWENTGHAACPFVGLCPAASPCLMMCAPGMVARVVPAEVQ